ALPRPLFTAAHNPRRTAAAPPPAPRPPQPLLRRAPAPAGTDALPPALIARLADTEVEATENWARRRRSRVWSEFVSQSVLDEVGKITADSELGRQTARRTSRDRS